MAGSSVLNEKPINCLHCTSEIPLGRGGSNFCCSGCEQVYNILITHGLSDYYRIRANTGGNEGMSPVVSSSEKFSYFDETPFTNRYVSSSDSDNSKFTCLYLEGIHCAACVWLIERLPSLLPGVVESRINFGRSLVHIKFEPSITKLSSIASMLNSLGYIPHPVSQTKVNQVSQLEERRLLMRIGVAGFCSGNIMVLAVSLYQGAFTGIEEQYSSLFSWTSLLLALPVITYSAMPFYRAAWGGLKNRILHIDLPIVIGIVAAFCASAVNTLFGRSHIYYDSITALVFLLLVGRWFQQRGIRRAADASDIVYALSPVTAVKELPSGEEVEVLVETLRKGDTVLVPPGKKLAIDGRIISGESLVDTSILTGESRLMPTKIGDLVWAGTTNVENTIKIIAESVGDQTRVGKLLAALENAGKSRPRIVQLTDRASGYFVAAVILLSLGTFYYWLKAGFFSAMDNTLALLVVTCPCALGLGAPVALSVALNRAAKRGIFIKGADVIERLCNVSRIFFDKTGTLTEGKATVVSAWKRDGDRFTPYDDDKLENISRLSTIIYQLEATATHPYAACLCRFVFKYIKDDTLTWDQKTEIPGQGVMGITLDSEIWFVGSIRGAQGFLVNFDLGAEEVLKRIIHSGRSPVVVVASSKIQAIFEIGDTVRTEAREVVEKFRDNRRIPYILSGDLCSVVRQVGSQLGIPQEDCYSEVSPERKAEIIRESQAIEPTAMVGDGINDAVSLKVAYVGIGVHGGAEACLQAADVFLGENGLGPVTSLFDGADRTMQTIHRNLVISLVYNVLGACGAMLGIIGPLVAAILMPLSSLTVILSSFYSKGFR